jgi:hypothetical protein
VTGVRPLLVALVCAAIVSCGACASTPPSTSASSPTQAPALSALTIKPLASVAGYRRTEFGPAWKDVDRNGCDTRNDILNRDLTNKTWRGAVRCVVLTGTLNDPYTGKALNWTKSRASTVQIDHVVSLANAWQTGAATWPVARREQFANDPLDLLAVDGRENESKGDDDASRYLPPNVAFRCSYVRRQIAVKVKYGLWVTRAEHDAMARVLATC